MPGIFGGNQVNFFQNAQCPQGYVFQVADRGGNHVE
jgi:hypothetical protein